MSRQVSISCREALDSAAGSVLTRCSAKTKATMEEKTGIGTSVDEDDVKRYLHEVLAELKAMKDENP
jgi:hypothetical protein